MIDDGTGYIRTTLIVERVLPSELLSLGLDIVPIDFKLDKSNDNSINRYVRNRNDRHKLIDIPTCRKFTVTIIICTRWLWYEEEIVSSRCGSVTWLPNIYRPISLNRTANRTAISVEMVRIVGKGSIANETTGPSSFSLQKFINLPLGSRDSH